MASGIIDRLRRGSRRYPSFPGAPQPTVPVSFVVVRYCDELEHNLATSPCVADPLNQLVVVDNRQNLVDATLCEGLLEGIRRAEHDVVVLVHEDVVLVEGWQGAFEVALARLGETDPNWWMVGVVGWTDRGSKIGHVSGPGGYQNNLSGRAFAPVERIDEHLMVMRRSDAHSLDPALPSIHNIGRDLAERGRELGRRSYVVDAATIHKYADERGNRIARRNQSPKIAGRASAAYRADKSFSDDYFVRRWPEADRTGLLVGPGPGEALSLPPPVVLLAWDEAALRAVAALAGDLEWYSDASGSLTQTEGMIRPVYRGLLGKLRYRAAYDPARAVEELQAAAGQMLLGAGLPEDWCFAVPETLVLIDEVQAAFDQARFIHVTRDPRRACLGEAGPGIRLDNPVGQAAVRAAYVHSGKDPLQALEDSGQVRVAAVLRHQTELALDALAGLPEERLLTLRYEDLKADPGAALQDVWRWMPDGQACAPPEPTNLSRVLAGDSTVDAPIDDEAAEVLESLVRRLGYSSALGA